MPKPKTIPCAHCEKPTGMFDDDGAIIHQSRHKGEVHINTIKPENYLTHLLESENGLERLKTFLREAGFVLYSVSDIAPHVNLPSEN
jgi:hypothetical protein